VLLEAHKIRLDRGDYAIDPVHLADAIEQMTLVSRKSLSADRSVKDPYHGHPTDGNEAEAT
jgi:glyoxalase family protein